jgi:hypothetical protein
MYGQFFSDELYAALYWHFVHHLSLEKLISFVKSLQTSRVRLGILYSKYLDILLRHNRFDKVEETLVHMVEKDRESDSRIVQMMAVTALKILKPELAFKYSLNNCDTWNQTILTTISESQNLQQSILNPSHLP